MDGLPECKPRDLTSVLKALPGKVDIKCYDIKPVRKEEGKSYWKIPLCNEDATREK